MLKLNYIFFVIIFFSVNILLVFNVYADCNYDDPELQNADFGKVIVQRDVPIGTEIATIHLNNYGYTWSDGSCKANIIMTYNGAKATSIDHVFETNITGVGIEFSYADSAGNYYASASPGTIAHGGENYGPGGWVSYGGVIHLIKTNNIISGTLTPGEVSQMLLTGNNGSLYDFQKFNLTGGTVTQVACSITTPQLVFNIGDISAAKFGNTIGTVPQNSEATQNLGLDCDADANINVMLTGIQNPDVTTNSVLALSDQGNTGTAQGVGVQLLYNNAPLELNSNIVLKKSAGGQETFPIVARYYQTKTTVMPGKANTSATLNLTYQ